jgi:hypothetical protein
MTSRTKLLALVAGCLAGAIAAGKYTQSQATPANNFTVTSPNYCGALSGMIFFAGRMRQLGAAKPPAVEIKEIEEDPKLERVPGLNAIMVRAILALNSEEPGVDLQALADGYKAACETHPMPYAPDLLSLTKRETCAQDAAVALLTAELRDEYHYPKRRALRDANDPKYTAAERAKDIAIVRDVYANPDVTADTLFGRELQRCLDPAAAQALADALAETPKSER